jgi:hypothetical protein
VVGICFILLALSGLACSTRRCSGSRRCSAARWTRILHPYIGHGDVLLFLGCSSLLAPTSGAGDSGVAALGARWCDGNDHDMPEVGKYNGGQKLLFWLFALCLLVLLVSGLLIWRPGSRPACRSAATHRVLLHARPPSADDRDHRARLRRHLGQGHHAGHDARHGQRRLGQAAPPLWYREQVQGRTAKAPSKRVRINLLDRPAGAPHRRPFHCLDHPKHPT